MVETETQLNISRESTPDDPGSAIGIMAELKANAALFSAFAFGSLNLPAPLIESTSKVILSQGVTVTSAKPIPDSALLQAFVLLDTATLCLMLVCVAASQLLIYRLADGSYGTIKYSTDDAVDRRDTALGRLVNQYRSEVRNHDRTRWVLAISSLCCTPSLLRTEHDHARVMHGVLLFSCSPVSRSLSPALFYSSLLTTDRRRCFTRVCVCTRFGQFRVARVSFALGLSTLLLAVGVKSAAVFDQAIALPATALVGGAAFTICSLYVRSYREVFRPLDQCDGFEECEASYGMQVPLPPVLPTLPGAAIGAALGMAIAFILTGGDFEGYRVGALSSSRIQQITAPSSSQQIAAPNSRATSAPTFMDRINSRRNAEPTA